MSAIEIVASVFGLACVWLTLKQNIWCWPVGLVQVVLFIFVFFQAKLYSDMILHVIYVGFQFYGWYHWLHGGGKERASLPVTTITTRARLLWPIVIAAGTVIWGYFMARTTDAALPYPDAFIIVASLSAQWLMARKRLESWLIWIVVDVVAIGVFSAKHLIPTAILYAVFLGLAIAGFLAWRRTMK